MVRRYLPEKKTAGEVSIRNDVLREKIKTNERNFNLEEGDLMSARRSQQEFGETELVTP